MHNHETLISVETLASRVDEPSLRVVDCRFNLLQPAAGRQCYLAGHIPGAVYADLNSDLLLKQSEVQPVLSDVVAKCPDFRRVLGRRWLLSSQVDMAKGQRNPEDRTDLVT